MKNSFAAVTTKRMTPGLGSFLAPKTKNFILAAGVLSALPLTQMEGKRMRIMAYVGNLLMLLGALALFIDQNGRLNGMAGLVFLGLLLVPLLNLWVLYTGPDREEMRLRREVNKAEMRAKLKALSEGKGSCCG